MINTMIIPDSTVHGANLGHTRVLSAPNGPHVGPMNHAIRVLLSNIRDHYQQAKHHCSDNISATASQITINSIVQQLVQVNIKEYTNDPHYRPFMRRITRWPVTGGFPHKGPAMRKTLPQLHQLPLLSCTKSILGQDLTIMILMMTARYLFWFIWDPWWYFYWAHSSKSGKEYISWLHSKVMLPK